MEQTSSSSKVTVEYFDPSGVYQLISRSLLARLPLRNLHWESHAGPLRSIDTLHVDLVPASDQPADNSDLSRIKSSESTRNNSDDGFKVQPLGLPTDKDESRATTPRAVKERRHQIPGLRQTPYLKVLLLRCDDSEVYKQIARKQVREWIKAHTPPQATSKSSAQENHDAFEWMVIHVVVPNTAAASQPRSVGKAESGGPASGDKPRWLSSSSTIFDKLRSDFNTSKSVDRIAQVRVGVNDVPYDMLPRVVPAIPGSYTETAQDNEAAWADLMTKIRSLILASFDLRVSQYEEDIREKDAQRALPGWNFCTFFVLKEGLARGFESVGLVEDALVGYDELALGLDAIVKEQATEPQKHRAFLPWTEDLKSRLEKGWEMLEQNEATINLQADDEMIDIPLSSVKKPYRELILSSNISLFDFRCYLFARQLAVLLRMGNAVSSREELLAKLKEQREQSLQGVAPEPMTQPSEDAEDLTVLSEVCRRALEFTTSIARTMRADLESAVAASDLPDDSRIRQLIDNQVASFTFSVAQQILAQTSTTSLPIPPSTLIPSDAHEPKSSIPEPKTMMHPARSSSLISPPIQRGPPSPGVWPDPKAQAAQAVSQFLKNGLEDLSARRGELYVLSRNVLEQLGKKRHWLVGWESITGSEIDLNESTPLSNGLENALLRTAMAEKDDFYRLYETMTDKALRHFTVANRVQSMQANMSDLAVLKYDQKDYAAAATYFYRMTPFYGEEGWTHVEMAMLIMYAMCLKELRRNDDYIRACLKLLAKGADSSTALDDDLRGYLPSLLEIATEMDHEVHAPLQSFLGYVGVDDAKADGSQDTFVLQLKCQYLQVDDLTMDSIRVRLAPIENPHSREIWFSTKEPVNFSRGTVKVQVESNVIIPGYYKVNAVEMTSGKLMLKYESDSNRSGFLHSPQVLTYQHPEAVDIKLSASRYMHLDRNRTLELDVFSGWNDISKAELRVRAGTAGLRLQTSETQLIDGSVTLQKSTEPGTILFDLMGPNQSFKLRMPFNLERDVGDITLRIELTYTTERGTFVFSTAPHLSILLPLGVNVQDVFKHSALFSRFTISSSTSSPLRILNSKLDSSEAFTASTGGGSSYPLVVYPRQPASLLYKITKASESKSTSLSLTIHYVCLEEEIDACVTDVLTQALKDTPYYHFARLVTNTVLSQVHDRLSPHEMERAAILGYLSTAFIATVRWKDYFTGLTRTLAQTNDAATLLDDWIREWTGCTPDIPLAASADLQMDRLNYAHSIIIPVDIPPVNVVFTADFQVQASTSIDSAEDGNKVVALTNEALHLTLNVKWTKIWDTKPNQHSNVDLEFVADITVPSDTFVLGGRRRKHFVVPAQGSPSSTSLPVTIIPLRDGYFSYPHVDIKPFTPPHAADSPAPPVPVTCETNFKNTAETLRVVANARRTTVSLDASGPNGGAWLLETERWPAKTAARPAVSSRT